MFSEYSWVDFCGPIITFYTAGELRQTKTRAISFYMILHFFLLYMKNVTSVTEKKFKVFRWLIVNWLRNYGNTTVEPDILVSRECIKKNGIDLFK